jgi:tetratricopeptide (TPR) repeat protein
MLRALVCLFCLMVWQPVAGQTAEPAQPPVEAYLEFMLARRLEGQGNSAGALEALKRARALDPTSAEIMAETAGLYARQNRGAEAMQAAEQALGLDPANLEAHRILGLVFSAWSEAGAPSGVTLTPPEIRERAIGHLSRVIDTPLAATDLNLQLTLARLQLRAGRADRAVPILENVVSQVPYATEPNALLAEGRVALGRIEAAIEGLTEAAALNPRHYVMLGELLEKQGRWADAAAAYERGVSSGRGVTRELRLRWMTALLNVPGGQGAARAREALKDFLVANPQDSRGLFLLATANLRVGDYTGAEDVARRLLAVDPTSLPALHALADALFAQREYRKVVDVLTPFAGEVAARPPRPESDAALILALLAHAHSELGEPDRAIAVLTTAIAHDPLSAPALNSLGYTLAERGERLSEAVDYIQRALKLDPDNPAYLDSLGWALYKQGRADQAEEPLRQAAEALPTQSIVQDHYGDVLARRGRLREAIGAWERALAGDGEDIDRSVVEKKIKDARGRQ